jgi:hypothetical protein
LDRVDAEHMGHNRGSLGIDPRLKLRIDVLRAPPGALRGLKTMAKGNALGWAYFSAL